MHKARCQHRYHPDVRECLDCGHVPDERLSIERRPTRLTHEQRQALAHAPITRGILATRLSSKR